MKPIDFKERNVIVAENQEEYMSLPALKFESGEIISCWKLSVAERLKVLLTGKIWHSSLSFNKSITPVFMTTNRKSVYYTHNDDKIKTKIIKWLSFRYGKGKNISLPFHLSIGKYRLSMYAMNNNCASLRLKISKEGKIILVIKKGIY